MDRPYFNPDKIQPRFAAWLGSIGLPVSEAGLAEARLRYRRPLHNVEFMIWRRRCTQTAPKEAVLADRVVDHSAFTEHCWKTAFGDVLAAQVSA